MPTEGFFGLVSCKYYAPINVNPVGGGGGEGGQGGGI